MCLIIIAMACCSSRILCLLALVDIMIFAMLMCVNVYSMRVNDGIGNYALFRDCRSVAPLPSKGVCIGVSLKALRLDHDSCVHEVDPPWEIMLRTHGM